MQKLKFGDDGIKELSVKYGKRSKWSYTKKPGQENTSKNNKCIQIFPPNFTPSSLTSHIHRLPAKLLQDGSIVFFYFCATLDKAFIEFGSTLLAEISFSDRSLYLLQVCEEKKVPIFESTSPLTILQLNCTTATPV